VARAQAPANKGRPRCARTARREHAIILLEFNDIGVSGRLPEQDASADASTEGLASSIVEPEASDVRIFLTTLLPF
jgi:hypothetical protein